MTTSPKEQVEKSQQIVEDSIAKSLEHITGVVQKHLSIEQERTYRFKTTKEGFQDQYKDILEKIEEERSEWGTQWDEILNKDNPVELDKSLRNMRQQCENVIAVKIAYIKDLEQEVMKRDHEYVNKIAAQNQQIDDMVKLMRESESDIRKKISNELSAVLLSYDHERSAEAIRIDKESKAAESKRQDREKTLMNEIINTAIANRDALEDLRRENAQKYLLQRTQFETELQAAQKEYEDALARYHFAMEQLDYDTRILTENQGEHDAKIKLQNKKISRQKDTIRSLQRRYEEEEKKFAVENAKITAEYKKIAENYRKLQERFRKVAYSDFNSFREVWNLNEKRLHDLILKVIDANTIITTQQLGKETKGVEPQFLARVIIGTEAFEDLTKTPQAPTEKDEENAQEKQMKGLLSGKKLSENLEHLWRLVSDEVGFLVDERVKNLIGLPEDEDIETSTMKIRVDLLLNDLGVTTDEDAAQLLSYFLKDTEFELETPGFVKPHEVLEGLKKFVEAYRPNTQHNQMNLFSQITQDATQNTSSEVAKAIMQLQGRMKKEFPKQLEFIEKKSEVVTEEMWRIWNASYKVMKRYVTELEERAKLIEETDSLKRQNAELEMILQRSIQSDANQDLIYAPHETVDF